VVDVDLLGDRVLKLQHVRRHEVPQDETSRDLTVAHLRELWGYEVVMEEVPAER
jgi:spore cortex formation protein SpoVR/YcgB (stage V sporulation)